MEPNVVAGMAAQIIVVSDRVASGDREDQSGTLVERRLIDAGLAVQRHVVVREGREGVEMALDRALVDGARVIVTVGGTGVGARNLTPEVSRERICCELPGVQMQVLLAGLANSAQAGLTRGVIGLTSRDERAALIVNAPSSRGGAQDCIDVVAPLLPNIFERFV